TGRLDGSASRGLPLVSVQGSSSLAQGDASSRREGMPEPTSYTPSPVKLRSALSSSVEQVDEVLDERRPASASGARGERAWRRAIFRDGWRPRPAVVIAFLLLVLSVPLVVALVVVRTPRWYPVLDLAWTE